MNGISTDRLIELAEKNLTPTADEQRLLRENPSLKTKLEEIRTLFADIRSLPDPAEDESLLQGILPAVRRAIEGRKHRSVFNLIGKWQPVPNFATALASLVLVFLIAFFFSGNGQPKNLPEYMELTFVDNITETTSIASTSVVLEASMLPEIDLFSNLDTELGTNSNDIYFDSSTFSLMDQATSLEMEEFEKLKNYITDLDL